MRNIYPLNPRFIIPFAFLLAVSLLAVSLLFMLPVGSLHAQTPDDAIEYPENGTGAVATFTAIDPEQTAIMSWSLTGTDSALLSIENGALSFKKSPDFEMAGDIAGADSSTAVAGDNIYEVDIRATDSTGQTGTKTIMVEVTDVDEQGTVTLSAVQPQSATQLTATLTDPDGTDTGTTWQWAKASSKNGTYGNITGATSGSYTPTDGDVGSYLRATASYTDPEGSGKSAMVTSEYAVQEIRATNRAPRFDGAPPIEVAENTPTGTPIGNPVVATDADGDKLTYTLEGVDAGKFDINWATGQLMTKEALDYNETAAAANTYSVTVKATDPAGVPGVLETFNSATVPVTIMVTAVNEPPVVTGDALVMSEEVVAGQMATPLGTYVENDPETNEPSTWSVSGADAGKFDISTGGELTFEAKPDYEMPGDANGDNTYEVTVVAADSDGNRGTMDVKVKVTNVEEDGVVTLSRTQPRVGVLLKATLTDPDGSISGLTWQWSRSTSDQSGFTDIEGAKSATYTPVDADAENNNGMFLRATASYTDGHGPMKSTMGTSAYPAKADTRNKAPVFEDQDLETDGNQNTMAERSVEENSVATTRVGNPVTAMDPDQNSDTLIYTLSGADAGLFKMGNNGQIEVGAGTKLDYETLRTTYMVTLSAEDSFGASASINVTIMVTDMDEKPDVTGDDTIEYAENGTRAVATFTATDPERASVSWSLAGDDGDDFNIAGGVLTFKKSPDYEADADNDMDNMYSVTVRATDATRMTGEKMVTVKLTNVEEAGKVTMSALRPQAGPQAGPPGIAITATLTDPDGGTSAVTWQWAKAGSRNGAYGNISDATSEIYMPIAGDTGSYLRVTASYTDDEGSGKSARANSEYTVQADRTPNAPPVFPSDDNIPISVLENTPAGTVIGTPVRATDPDGDILTYTLEGSGAEFFDINWATGQIMTKAPLNADISDGGTTSYSVTVRATDPGGVPGNTAAAANSATVPVTITVTDVNEAPDVAGAALVMSEEVVAGQIATPLGTYVENDPETNEPSTWSVSGADAGKFDISTGGELTFEAKPDYEMPGDANGDNTYEVTVVAADSDGNRGTMDVKVKVTNVEEDGVVTLSRTQPRVGVLLKATLSDPDGSISGLRWQWYRGDVTTNECADANADNCLIEGARSDTYTPTEGDEEESLTAAATYTDGFVPASPASDTAIETSPTTVAKDTRNKPPVFDDQDTDMDGDQNESATRDVEENAEAMAAVGSPVMATGP